MIIALNPFRTRPLKPGSSSLEALLVSGTAAQIMIFFYDILEEGAFLSANWTLPFLIGIARGFGI